MIEYRWLNVDGGGAGMVLVFLLTKMAGAVHGPFEWSLDCQQMKIYCVSTPRCFKARAHKRWPPLPASYPPFCTGNCPGLNLNYPGTE